MKTGRLSALLSTPLGLAIGVGAAVLGAELLFMALLHGFLMVQFELPHTVWDVIDAATLAAIVAPVLYFAIQKRHENAKLMRRLIDTVQDAIVIVNEQGRITRWNRAAQGMFQYRREEALGQPMHQLITPPRYRDGAARGFARFQATGDGPMIGQTIKIPALRKDGGEFPVELSLSAFKLKDRWYAIGIIRDLTERQQIEGELRDSEEKYRTMIENSNDMIWTLAADGSFTFINQQAADVTGRSIEEWIGKSFAPLVLEDDLPMVLEIHGKIMRGEKARYEVRGKKADGSVLNLSVNAGPVTKDGKVCGTISFARDITEAKKREHEMQEMLEAANQSRRVMLGVIEDQKRAEDALRQLNEELEGKVAARTADLERARLDAEQANRAKSAFLAAMSHEIRTPMNGVIGMVDVLHQSSLHGYQVEMVDLIRESAYSLLGIINDILDFSKIEAGKLELETAPMMVADVVEDICGMLDHMAMKKGVEITLFTDPAIPAEVTGDTLRLRQVLVNIVNNAIKFSGKQQRRGRVSVRAVLAERRPGQVTVALQVADNGIGMDAETLSVLFTPFTQADITTTRRFGGTGLGLSIAHHLVEMMGGKITVQSEPGKGSTFTVHLPFELLPAKPAVKAAEFPVTGLSCLVVGGNSERLPGFLAGDLSAYLAHAGVLVERAEDMAAVQDQIANGPPGLCIVIIDADGAPASSDELRAIARAHPQQEARFVVIRRGWRRGPRLEDAGLVSVDRNALTCSTFLKAVAIAAGRAQVEESAPARGKGEAEFSPPSRDDALRRGQLILVVEDNETNQKVILRQLALFGFAADVADNGRVALERWRSGDYALLLSDLHMPEMDGYELTAAIRAAEQGSRHIPIVALTANALKGAADHCRAIGMDDYLSKPTQLADLKAMLDKWLPVAIESAPDFHPPPLKGKGRLPPPLQGEGWGGDGLNQNNSLESHAPIPPPTPPLKGGENAAAAAVPVDVSVLKALVGDDPVVVREFLSEFRISANKISAELGVACNGGKAAPAGALAHKLKSSARSMGALALGELCAAMEQAGKSGDNAALTMLWDKFETEMAAVNESLGSILDR